MYALTLPWFLAMALPYWVTAAHAPITSFYNSLVALLGWSLLWLTLGWREARRPGGRPSTAPDRSLRLALPLFAGALAALALLQFSVGRALLLLGAAFAFGLLCVREDAVRDTAAQGCFIALLMAGVVSAGVCVVQFFLPEAAGSALVSASSTPGRATGNLRQPNHQALLSIWAAIAAGWLAQRGRVAVRCFGPLLLMSVFTVALTGSRTGMVLTGLLLLWGLLDRSLPRAVRGWLIAAPLLLLACSALLSAWADWAGASYFAGKRAQSSGDISSSRFAIWSDTLALIAQQPWTGVGWGNFNFAWTLTPFPQRPVAFFDHAHNLPLQLAVELGVPAALALCGAFLWLSWHARGALRLAHGAATARATLLIVAAVLFHSLLEYPLWYAYFLLPAAFAWGLYLGLGWPQRQGAASLSPRRAAAWAVLAGAGAVTAAGALYAAWDYQRVRQVFAPLSHPPLSQRIAEGQRSALFGGYADYAAVTTAARPSEVFGAFERPLRQLLDARLMIAYARALEERGERDKAVYVAQRLREFRHPQGDKFFAVCDAPRQSGEAAPFQCETAPVQLTYRDFQGFDR